MTQPPQNIFSSAPFRNAASQYFEKGWDILPLPYRMKEAPPKGYTGRISKGIYPTVEQVEKWKSDAKYERGNICVRVGRPVVIDGMQLEVIGIDVDDYDDKNGWNDFAELEEAHGKFPDTWTSSARADCRSGIRWVLVPSGFEYRGQASASIEIVQQVHRYGVVYPSYNPDAQAQYYWYAPGVLPNGRDFSPVIPAVEELALLPQTWFEHLKKGTLVTGPEAIDVNSNSLQLRQWFESNLVDPNTMCRTMKRQLRKRIDLIENGESHHDPLVAGHMNLFLLGVEGHNGWRAAIVEMEKAWLARLDREGLQGKATRTLWVAKTELLRSREGAMRKIKGRIDAGTLELKKCDNCALQKNLGVAVASGAAGSNGGGAGSNGGGAGSNGGAGGAGGGGNGNGNGGGDIIGEKFTKGQVSLALFLERKFAGKVIFVPNIGWHIWDGKRWREDIKGIIGQYVLRTMNEAVQLELKKRQDADQASTDALRDKLLEEADKIHADVASCQSSGAIDGILKIARAQPRIATDSMQLDYNPYLLNLQNGTLNLKTHQLQPHNPKDFITKVCHGSIDPAVAFDPDKHCPQWMHFLETVLPDEKTRHYLQQIMGVGLVGTQLEHMLLILHGNGRNGKGVFERVLRFALGDYGVSAASDLLTGGTNNHTTSQTDLMGKRLAVIDETESNAKLSEALVKKLTGGGDHTARRMHQNNVRFPMTWLAMMITNHLPSIDGKGAAIWDRLVVIKFPVYFSHSEQNKQLDEILKSESSGILLWAYAGWRAYQKAGHQLTQPDSVKEAIKDYQDAEDELGVWLRERVQHGEGELFLARPDDLLKDFVAWCTSNGIAVSVTKHKFMTELRQKNLQYSRSLARFLGVRLNPARAEFAVKH